MLDLHLIWMQLPQELRIAFPSVLVGWISKAIYDHLINNALWAIRFRYTLKSLKSRKKKLETEMAEARGYDADKQKLILKAVGHFINFTSVGIMSGGLALGGYLFMLQANQFFAYGLVGTLIILIALLAGTFFISRECNRLIDTALTIKRVLTLEKYEEKVIVQLGKNKSENHKT